MAARGPTAASVDEYIASFPKDMQARLKKVRATIRKAAPGATESISYGLVGYKYGGQPVVYFGGFAKHYSLFGGTSQTREIFKAELAKYKGGKGTIRFPLDEPVPTALVAKITKSRLADAKEVGATPKAKRKPVAR